MKNILENLIATFNFFRSNPHSIPIVSKLCCKLGRHDYELKKVRSNSSVQLQCFYCLHEKGSSFREESK